MERTGPRAPRPTRGAQRGSSGITRGTMASSRPTLIARRERELTERLLNLSLVLAEDAEEEVPELPDEACELWTESDVREFYRTGGRHRPDEETPWRESEDLPGGTREENSRLRWSNPRDEVDASQAPGSEDYKRVAMELGIRYRPDGLFPPGDKILAELSRERGNVPFEKLLLDEEQRLVTAESSWAAGNAAAVGGRIDLRCFLCDDWSAEEEGTTVGSKLKAAVRFGDGASIGNGMSAHGGAIETVLDEATAELCKITQGPMCFTTQFEVSLKRPVALHETYVVECEIVKLGIRGMRIFVEASITAEDGNVVAECKAQLANMAKIKRSRT